MLVRTFHIFGAKKQINWWSWPAFLRWCFTKLSASECSPCGVSFTLKIYFIFLDTKGDICINQVPEFMKVYFVLFAASQKYMFYLFVTVFRVSALLMNVFHWNKRISCQMYVHINSSFPKENDTIFWHYFDHVTFGRRYFIRYLLLFINATWNTNYY